MAGQNTAIALGGAAVAGAVGGPLATVFSELALVLALMGGFGGMARGLSLRLAWREVLRGVVLGGLFATGLGALLPYVVKPLIGVDAESTSAGLAACAFLAGFCQDLIIERLQRGGKK